MKVHFDNNQGFSLIELLIALTIFAIGLLALAGMQVTAIRGNSTAHSLTTVTDLSDGLIEQLWARSGDDPLLSMAVNDVAWPENFQLPDTPAQWELAGGGTLSATYTIVPNQPIAGVSQISVVVASNTRTLTKTAMKRTF